MVPNQAAVRTTGSSKNDGQEEERRAAGNDAGNAMELRETFNTSEENYDRYRPSSKKQVEFSEKDLAVWKGRLADAGFASVEAKLYRRKRTLTTEQYIGLLNTYSDHIALPEETKWLFEEEMRHAIDAAGGSVNIYDTIDLYMGKAADMGKILRDGAIDAVTR